MQEELLFPLKYKIPLPHDLHSAKETQAVRDFGGSTESRKKLLEQTLADIEHQVLGQTTWTFFCQEYLHYLHDNPDISPVRDGWLIVQGALEDPVDAFKGLSASSGDTTLFPGIDQRFVAIADEMLRDGVVTKTESDFLWEKAREYGVDGEDFDYVLETKQSMNTTLLGLIDEVCQDGKISEVERALLEEKSNEFGGISRVYLDRMMDRSLRLHQDVDGLNRDPLFKGLVGGIFLCMYILHARVLAIKLFRLVNKYLCEGIDEMFESRLRVISKNLVAELNSHLGFSILGKIPSLSDVLEKLSGLLSPENDDDQRALELRRQTLPDSDIRVRIDGLRFQVYFVQNRFGPMFHHEVHGTAVDVFLNKKHPFLQEARQEGLNLAVKLTISMSLTRLQLYADTQAFDEFFELMNINDKVVTRSLSNSVATVAKVD